MAGFPRTALLLSSVDPNDPVASDQWTDLARTRLYKLSNAGRGRNVDLGVSAAGRLDADLLNLDEYLNRANLASPLLSSAEVMRRIRWMAVYPADGTGNLLNVANMGADPSFESYGVGVNPPWVLRFGNNFPTVTTTGPHTGTKALVQSIVAGAGLQGIVFDLEFVPGDVYLVSIWVNQTVANTIDLVINGHLGTPMASTTATGYTQLVGIFQADQPSLQVCVIVQAPTLNGTITFDEPMVEIAQPLNANTTFQRGLSPWAPVNGARLSQGKLTLDLPGSMLVTPDGVSVFGKAGSEEIPAVPGRRYAYLASVRPTGVSAPRAVGLDFYDAAHSYLTTLSNTLTYPADAWGSTGLQVFTAPAGAAFVRLATDTGNVNLTTPWHLSGPAAYHLVPSAFTTFGPRVRSLWGGHVSGLTINWDTVGNGGTAKLSGVGPLATLSGTEVDSEYLSYLKALAPDYLWSLWDGPDATSWAETSGRGGPSLRRVDAPVGPSPTFTSGTAIDIPGDPGATGVSMVGNLLFGNASVSVLMAGRFGAGSDQVSIGSAALPVELTVAFWLVFQPFGADTGYLLAMFDDSGHIAASIQWGKFGGVNKIFTSLEFAGTVPNTGSSTGEVGGYMNGKPHLVTVTWAATATSAQWLVYIDGVLLGTFAPNNPTADGWTPPYRFTNIQVGGAISPFNRNSFSGPPGGVYNGVAIWNRKLSATEIANLWGAGQGYPGELTGSRMGSLLNKYYIGPRVVDAGTTKLQPSQMRTGSKLQPAIQRVMDSEGGPSDLFENRKGGLQFDSRTTRFLATTAQGVFGENAAGGEVPYSGSPTFGYDLTGLLNQATVTQADGTKVVSEDLASQRSFYNRATSVQTDAQDPLVAKDQADWIVANQARPKLRVERITLDPGANPSIWPAVMDLEKGQRWTLKRRAKAANGGAGLTMSTDYFIEHINHRNVDFEKGTWQVDLILTPAPLQPWILGDPTYGQLGITTVLGF